MHLCILALPFAAFFVWSTPLCQCPLQQDNLLLSGVVKECMAKLRVDASFGFHVTDQLYFPPSYYTTPHTTS